MPCACGPGDARAGRKKGRRQRGPAPALRRAAVDGVRQPRLGGRGAVCRISCGRHGAEKPCGRIPGRAPGGAAHRRGYIRRGAQGNERLRPRAHCGRGGLCSGAVRGPGHRLSAPHFRLALCGCGGRALSQPDHRRALFHSGYGARHWGRAGHSDAFHRCGPRRRDTARGHGYGSAGAGYGPGPRR